MMFKTWIFLLTVSIAECVFTVTCGPNMACICTVESGDNNTTKMDCSDKQLHISDICKSVGSASKLKVTELDASANNVSVIRKSSEIKGCETLKVLNLHNNDLKWIGKHVFDGLRNLTFLNLSMNELNIYKEEGLQNFTKLIALQTLGLNGNFYTIENIDNSSYPALSLLPKLNTLFLDGLTNTAFDKSYANIEKLTLSGYISTCHLGNLTRATFQHLKEVQHLNLSKCDIKNIEAETFSSLHNLERLDLSYNQRLGFRSLRNVSYGLQYTNLKFLNYSNVYNTFGVANILRKKDLCYLRNSSITELVLNGNSIQLFETNSAMLLPKMLEVIHLDENKFTFAPSLLQTGCAQNLKQIFASYQNKFHSPLMYNSEDNSHLAEPEIDDERDDCPYMKDEYLKNISNSIPFCKFFASNNVTISFKNLPAIPAKTTKIVLSGSSMQYEIQSLLILPLNNTLEHIDLSGNIFHSWKGPIIGLSKLKYLDLTRNYCSYIGRDFFSLFTTLEELQISQNFIGLILASQNGIFDKLSSLKTLNLTSNRITTIPQNMFNKLVSLETLDLSANSIDNLDIDTYALMNLTNLNVSHNSLQTLPLSLTEHLTKVAERRNKTFSINMRNNSIKVSCQYEHFLNWMIKHQSNFVDFESYVFVNDNNGVILPSKINEYVLSLSKSCKSYTLLIVICSIGLSVFLAVVIGGVIYKKRWKLRYMLYMAKGRYNGYMAIPDGEPQGNYRYDAFISYTADNIRFILDEIIPKLEKQKFELCIHQRDFMPGNAIADNIMDAIIKSRVTVVILTEAYLKSKWCIYEFNMARMESLYTRNNENTLLFVMLENVTTKHMPLEMVQWIKENSYLEYANDTEGNLLFWNNLKDALLR